MKMRVAELIGITDEAVVRIVERKWDHWCDLVPDLAVMDRGEFCAKRLTQTSRDITKRVLAGLVELSSQSGCDDTEATSVLMWLMEPAAVHVAMEASRIRRDQLVVSAMYDRTEAITERVAATMWSVCRTWKPGRGGTCIAYSIKMEVRRQVLLQMGQAAQIRKIKVAPGELFTTTSSPLIEALNDMGRFAGADSPESVMVELVRVLSVAESLGEISKAEKLLLVDLVIVANQLPSRNHAGLSPLSRTVVSRVASDWGMGRTALLGKVRNAIKCLAAAAAAGRLQAA